MAYLDDINGSTNHTPSYTEPKLCYNNQAIMEISLESDNFTLNQLRRVNCVQMYLGFTYLSELCNLNSRSIHTSILSWPRNAGPYRTSLSRPNQPNPNTWSWLLWEHILQLVTWSDGKTLKTSLGPWTGHHSIAERWQSYHLETQYLTMSQQPPGGINTPDVVKLPQTRGHRNTLQVGLP